MMVSDMSLRTRVVVVILLLMAGGPARADSPKAKRARPPKFNKSVTDAFFPDASEKLVGEPSRKSVPPAEPPSAPDDSPREAASSTAGWARLISREAIEDQIKSHSARLREALKNPAKFKSGDFKQAQLNLSVLAVLFAIDAQYEAKVRWHAEAPGMRDLVAHAASQCKSPSDASLKEAKACAAALDELIRGNGAELTGERAISDWSAIAPRPQLMKRLAHAQEQVLLPGSADEAGFSRRLDELSRESQLVAALAAVIAQPAYEFADDETYREYAEQMKVQALAAGAAIENKNLDAARAAIGRIGKSCIACHEGYRN